MCLATRITKSHEFFSTAIRVFGVSALAELWKKSQRSIYRWAADMDFCEETTRNPIELLSVMMERFLELGRKDVVDDVLRLIVEPLGYNLSEKEVRSTKSVWSEMMDINIAVGQLSERLQEIMEDGNMTDKERLTISALADTLIKETMDMKEVIRQESLENIL
jgi:hypothetical protein